MNNLIKITFFVFLLSCGQDITYENNIKEDLIFLADDKLEGRKTGTEGEKLAAKYISNRFENLNLSDKGTENYYQEAPSWSPNGRVLIFYRETKTNSKGEGFSAKLWSIDLTGYNERQIETPTDASDPSWSSLLSN